MSYTPNLRLNDISNRNKRNVALSEFLVMPDQHWAIIGGNGSGKSTFAAMIAGDIQLKPSQRETPFDRVLLVSFEEEQRLLEKEIYDDDSEFIDKVDQGRTTYELITKHLHPEADLAAIIETLQLEPFLHTGFRILSTGERRRMMIARALSQAPEMLVLDEPYDGLDHAFVSHLKPVIAELSQQIPVLLTVNRLSHLGDHISHIACLHKMELVLTGTRREIEASALWKQLESIHQAPRAMPEALAGSEPPTIEKHAPVIEMRSVNVGYHDKPIISGLDWKMMPDEHWKFSGPNGSGKSTLLSLVSGDHSQCYGNEIYILGNLRGQGESIWDIKRHMGLMSTALHQQYRVLVTCEVVLLSGFFDTIGVYAKVTAEQRNVATEWLSFIGLDAQQNTLFQSLSFGQQRMLLIARALIKRPRLLLLDEPCQGLDPINRALVMQLIQQIADQRIAQILYISHDSEDNLPCLTHELRFIPCTPENEASPPFRIEQRALK